MTRIVWKLLLLLLWLLLETVHVGDSIHAQGKLVDWIALEIKTNWD